MRLIQDKPLHTLYSSKIIYLHISSFMLCYENYKLNAANRRMFIIFFANHPTDYFSAFLRYFN